MQQINTKIQSLKPSATLAINQKVKELRSKGASITHFGFGQSPFPIHTSIVKELQSHAANNHYLPTEGLPELQAQIALFLEKHQQIKADKKFIYIGPGSKELLYQTILIFESTFLIPKGSWVSYLPQIKSKGGKYSVLDTFLENDFKLTPEVLKSYCVNHSNEQKALILNSPNNPTGAVYTNKELKELAAVCRDYNIVVLSDEIYSQINFSEESSPSIAQFYPEKTIVFGGLSKVFSAGGYRLGFMVLPADLQQYHTVYRSLFSETFSSVSSPVQYAAIEAFKMTDEIKAYVRDSSEILKGVSNYIYNEFTKIGIECTTPSGAFYMMVGFNKFQEKIRKLNIHTSEQLSSYFIETLNVALLPSSDFYFKDEELFFRLAFVDFDGEKVMKAFQKEREVTVRFIENYCPNIYRGVNQLKNFIDQL